MVYIAYFTEFNLKFCKNDGFVAKIVNMRLTKIFMAIFAPDERLPSSATLLTYHEQLSIKQAYESGRVVVTSSLGVAECLKDWVCLHNLVLQGHLEI